MAFFPHPKRKEIVSFLKNLQAKIIHAFEQLETGCKFEKTPWNYKEEGGGEIALLRGHHFEKAAVNWSGVGGSNYPLNNTQEPFFATGVSLITHMANPHAPTAHMNVRFIETKDKFWFGGGYDLTPMGFPYDSDTEHFHDVAKRTLDAFNNQKYKEFSENAKTYFYIPHRKEERGVGGIFFDYYNSGEFEQDCKLWQAVGESFLDAILPIYTQRIHQPYTSQDKDRQLIRRGRYVEFNLLYDRGTKFGFNSGGNPDAILCSMPPLVKW